MEDAVEEVKAIDSYYLVPCDKPPVNASNELQKVLELYEIVMLDYADCYHRHNSLIEQVK